jgi:hypothetical protein
MAEKESGQQNSRLEFVRRAPRAPLPEQTKHPLLGCWCAERANIDGHQRPGFCVSPDGLEQRNWIQCGKLLVLLLFDLVLTRAELTGS